MFIGTCLYCDAGFMTPSPDTSKKPENVNTSPEYVKAVNTSPTENTEELEQEWFNPFAHISGVLFE